MFLSSHLLSFLHFFFVLITTRTAHTQVVGSDDNISKYNIHLEFWTLGVCLLHFPPSLSLSYMSLFVGSVQQ